MSTPSTGTPPTNTRARLAALVPRRHRVTAAACTLGGALATTAQAVLLARLLTATDVAASAAGLAAAVATRAGLSWARSASAARVATAAVAGLRERLLADTAARGPVALAAEDPGTPAALVTRLGALEPYFTGYRPARLAAVVTPVVVVAGLAVLDPVSAVVAAATLPLVPLFAALVGAHTARRTARQWGLLARLGGHFLDVVAGLPTLRAFGRAEHQVGVVARMADAHRRATVATLRVAFLSALVLEVVTTMSVALVAVPVGLRLLDGAVGLGTALAVLFLAPEACLPLRAAGTAFHAGAEGVSVAEAVFARLDAPPAAVPAPSREPGLALEDVTVRYPGRDAPALRGASLRVRPGEHVALVGPSGAGKSTVLAALLGFVAPERGRVGAGPSLAWVPQRPHLFAASLADNIRLGCPGAGDAAVRAAAAAAQLDDVVTALPDGYDTVLGEGGAGLSAGQAQRVALARAFLRDAPVLLLDEPTAHLDAAAERAVLAATERLMTGRTVLVVAHRPAVLPLVDRVLRVDGGRVAPDAVEGAA